MCTRAISIFLISLLLFCGCAATQSTKEEHEIAIESKTIKDFYSKLNVEKNSTTANEQNSTQSVKETTTRGVEVKKHKSIKEVINMIYEKEGKKCVVKGENYIFNIEKSAFVTNIAELNLLLKNEKIPLIVESISVYGYDRVYINGIKNDN